MMHNENKAKDNLPLVSVVMIAYNLEEYIAEAIESVINQKTNYPIEIIIGEDKSQDSTRKIIESFAIRYPNKIKPIYNKINLGLTPNFINVHNHCNGKYIALLDGDDFWTDENKIQKQVDFLENNVDYSGVAHQSHKIYSDSNKESNLFGETVDRTYSLKDMLTHRKFHTSSFVYRKNCWENLNDLPTSISSNERALFPGVAIYGKIKYFKESMCVYRFTGNGLTSRVNYKELKNDFNMVDWLKSKSSIFPVSRLRSFLHLCMYTYGVYKPPVKIVLKHYLAFVYFSFSYFPRNLGDIKWGTIFAIRAIRKT